MHEVYLDFRRRLLGVDEGVNRRTSDIHSVHVIHIIATSWDDSYSILTQPWAKLQNSIRATCIRAVRAMEEGKVKPCRTNFLFQGFIVSNYLCFQHNPRIKRFISHQAISRLISLRLQFHPPSTKSYTKFTQISLVSITNVSNLVPCKFVTNPDPTSLL